MTIIPTIKPLVQGIVQGLMPGNGAADSLVFHALTYDTSTYEMKGVLTGTGSLTCARAGDAVAYTTDGTNTWTQTIGANEPNWHLARRVENLALHSNDFSNAAWVKSNVSESSGTITATAANGTLLQTVTLASSNVTLRCKLKRVTGSGNIDLTVDGGSTWTTVSVTSTSKVFTVSGSAVTNPQFGIRIVTDTDAVLIEEAQLENTTGAAATTPSEYISTTTAAAAKSFANQNGNSVASNVVTEAVGNPLPVRTVENLLTYSEDFSNAAWTKSNATVSGGVVDPNGGTDAFTLTATGASGSVSANIGGGDGQSMIASVWVRRVTGTGTVEIFSGGSSGAKADITSSLTSSWRRFSSNTVPGGATRLFGVVLATSGDEVDISYAQAEDSTDRYISLTEQDETIPSEYVATTAAAASQTFNGRLNNTVSSNVVTEADATPDSPWLAAFPSSTNSLTYSLPDTTNWSLTEGSAGDLVTNGTFATDTDWTKGTGWSIGSGVASCDGTQTATSLLGQSISFTEGQIYKMTYTVSNYSAGSVRIQTNNNVGTIRSANGTYTEYIGPMLASQVTLYIQAFSDFIGDIDDVIVTPCIVEQYTTGMDGQSDSACVLHDDDGSAYEYVRVTPTVPSDTNPTVLRIFVKKDTDETRFPAFTLFYSATSRIGIRFNTKTGATSTVVDNGTTDVDVRDTGAGWWEIALTTLNESLTVCRIDIEPAAGTVIGAASTAATGSITLHSAELHLNTSIAEIRGRPPLPRTEGATVTVAATDYSYNASNLQDNQGGVYLEWYPLAAYNGISGGSTRLFGDSLIARGLYVTPPSGRLFTGDGTTASNNGINTNWDGDTSYKVGMAYDTTSGRVTRLDNSSWDLEGLAYDGSWNVSTLAVGGGPLYPMLFRDVRLYDLASADAQAQIDDLMA